MKSTYKPTIGLEVHVELRTNSKMFCSCPNDPNEKRPNQNICPTCMGHPGTLPVANEEAIKKVIKTGFALNCEIATESKFDRKNYFYPDIPKGYQISQYDMPLCGKGFLEINGRKIGITRIHLEEDTGSSLHPEGADYSLVNYNRAGVPLMELVTEPDITSGKEASDFAKELQLIFKYLGVSDADMEKGLMRVEVNISVSKTKKLGTKVEIKNLNSFKVVEKSIDFEIARQTELLESGGDGSPVGLRPRVVQETRGWNDEEEETFSQREKESAHDYRYFPEPDLPPLHFDHEYLQKIKGEVPELPQHKRLRFAKEYGLEESQIEVFVANKDLSEYFEKVASEGQEKSLYKLAANYLISDVQGLLGNTEFVEETFKITPENFAEFIAMIHKGDINSKTAKMVLLEMFNTGVDSSHIVESNNWGQMKDDGQLEAVVKKVIDANPKVVADYKAGNANVLQFLAGQVMKETRGTANPQKVQELLKKFL
ncbi:MAG: glutaminyl-tRNA synthase (glutamine-hydrolyzing) subunit B [Candidatus Staskawiczbacteria bacterium RIFCSPHIGHO2_02_FULL_43_16]|uniref:Aspartyl/glutamyl-tRNA(Asn/Gln) amidotransferase subunit B n=1 Tax=Candidatus Staskawiczbacteria bacterium RIFCSPHIGHO2_01_FULL_41_41 TaxID=1802203 RepID=A0A1G2HVF8_9BACT|nr:MAG: glutaminyl-tRNA synthase (glutamine-hydrolyzing) subunit B [Candidatus Staskawiczbacteria bacterium RIFCSPHIGHO2_01_FULL_41_41]OGZ69099.1 MAG: glutaminyl-tRNA synthase (glutamine-hydrolyzing) subunit B [Candidatus Staskawiczbacteria bacterium RIFCSPHIGHO2_02_FULL_43_16]OGZ74474.1 MAG: glutaminyl-tRNA synthase (glutamine-hydrolyzing) subunit B [Candidatus Staskawiczbacteria bacterium RIFCSPLOWO2_01_FULL_43_17b]